MQILIDWILRKNPELGPEFGLHEDLIEGRLIDSVDFLEFVLLLEEVSGRHVDLAEFSIDDFRTLAIIQKRFLDDPVNEIG
jgi:acyl carrier protein